MPLLAVLLFAPIAHADPIADKRAEATRVTAQLDQSARDLQVVIERYNEATVRLDETASRIRSTRARLRLARANLGSARQDLAGALVVAYKSGEPDPLAALLGAESVDALLDEFDLIQRATRFNARTVTRVRSYKQEIVVRERTLVGERERRESVVASQAARRAQVETLIAQREAYYASLQSDIRRLIEDRRAAEQRAALARARAARATLERESEPQRDTSPTIASIGGAAAQTDEPTAESHETVYAPPPASGVGAAAASAAMQYLGVPYVWAGASPSGFDCSGLVIYAYAQAGKPGLPHYTGSLVQLGSRVSVSELAPGDLVFRHAGHVGIYIGGGQMVHAPQTGDVVKVSPIPSSPWASVRIS